MKLVPLLLLTLLCACRKDIAINGAWQADDINAYDTVVETAPPVHKAVYTTIGTDVRSGYWETLPALYYKTTKRYPLIVFNHGVGENGNTGKTLSGINCCGLPKHAYNKTFPANFGGTSFIVVSPQYYNRPTGAQVQEVVQYAVNKYRVDPTRIYVVGMSQGGGVTMEWAKWYGEKAAAIFPSCPGLYPKDSSAKRIAGKNLPIWWTYGTDDTVVPPSQGYTWQNMIDGYNPAYAPLTKLTVWTGDTHNETWAHAFNPLTKVDGKNAYEWLLQYRRTGNVPPVAKVSDDIVISWDGPMLYATYSYDPDGWIAAFTWAKISGAACTVATPTAGKTRVSGLAPGTYVFRCTVTDNKGATAYDDVKVTMK